MMQHTRQWGLLHPFCFKILRDSMSQSSTLPFEAFEMPRANFVMSISDSANPSEWVAMTAAWEHTEDSMLTKTLR